MNKTFSNASVQTDSDGETSSCKNSVVFCDQKELLVVRIKTRKKLFYESVLMKNKSTKGEGLLYCSCKCCAKVVGNTNYTNFKAETGHINYKINEKKLLQAFRSKFNTWIEKLKSHNMVKKENDAEDNN